MAEGRSKRRCVLRKTAVPDAVHYVGYVEEEETPEMIMKKFEELERIVAKNNADNGKADDKVAVADTLGADKQQTKAQEELDHAQLQEIFKATSVFSVKAVLGNNQALMDKQIIREQEGCWSDGDLCSDDEDDVIEELKGFWSDGDWDSLKKQRSTRERRPAKERGPREPKLRSSASARNARTTIITQYNRDTHAFIRRRVRVLDPDAILQLRVPPPPLPVSWGRVVKPLKEKGGSSNEAGSSMAAAAAGPAVASTSSGVVPSSSSSTSYCHHCSDLTQFPYSSLQPQHFMAVLISNGWETPASAISTKNTAKQRIAGIEAAAAAAAAAAGDKAAAAAGPGPSSSADPRGGAGGARAAAGGRSGGGTFVGRLRELPLQQLCPKGFIFIWLHKEFVADVVDLMYSLGYSYVENLTWVLTHANHSILRLPHQYSCRSHITLYIFRREGEGRDIELRHQRSPDVVFDCVVTPDGSSWQTPLEVFNTIETLLPQGPGSFLEMWAPRGVGRPGWTHLVECEKSV